jgi:hypothetical protein
MEKKILVSTVLIHRNKDQHDKPTHNNSLNTISQSTEKDREEEKGISQN